MNGDTALDGAKETLLDVVIYGTVFLLLFHTLAFSGFTTKSQ